MHIDSSNASCKPYCILPIMIHVLQIYDSSNLLYFSILQFRHSSFHLSLFRLPLVSCLSQFSGSCKNVSSYRIRSRCHHHQIGQVANVLKTQGTQLLLPVALLHGAAFALGYWLSRLSFGESTSRTTSIECRMQRSALGFLLAQKHFTDPLVVVPSAVRVVCMALGGSALAVFWRNKSIPVDDKDDFKE